MRYWALICTNTHSELIFCTIRNISWCAFPLLAYTRFPFFENLILLVLHEGEFLHIRKIWVQKKRTLISSRYWHFKRLFSGPDPCCPNALSKHHTSYFCKPYIQPIVGLPRVRAARRAGPETIPKANYRAVIPPHDI